MDDPVWEALHGGYRVSYDPRPALAKLPTADPAAAWAELWQELHHQGDVGDASYAAIPALVERYADVATLDWNLYALAAVIELARRGGDNPAIPDWLIPSYRSAWSELERRAQAELPAATDPVLIDSIIAVLAVAKGRSALAAMALMDESERQDLLDPANWRS